MASFATLFGFVLNVYILRLFGMQQKAFQSWKFGSGPQPGSGWEQLKSARLSNQIQGFRILDY